MEAITEKYAPIATARARLGAGDLDTLNHQTRCTVVRADGEPITVVADDGDDPTARLRVALR